MPYRTPQVYMQQIGIDYEDKDWVESTDQMMTYIDERMVSFDFSDHSEKIDELKVSFINSDRALCDLPLFVVGQKFLVAWGWQGQLCEPRQMIVAKRENGNPYVVYLRDPMIMLAQRRGHRHKNNATDSEFVREIAEEWGYIGTTANITETKVRHEITQSKKRTDATQLFEMARRNGFTFYIDGSGLYWGPRETETEPIETFIFRTDPNQGSILTEPQITQKTDSAAAQVIVQARDPITKRSFKIKVSADTTTDITSLGGETELDDPGNSPDSKRTKRASRINVVAIGYKTEDEAKAIAQAIYRDNIRGMYTMAFSIIGDPKILAKKLIEIEGHSATFDGLYYLREARHVIRAGKYTTELTADRDALTSVAVKKKTRLAKTNKAQKKATSETETQTTPEGEVPLSRVLGVAIGSDGGPVAVWKYGAPGDDPSSIQTSQLSADELAALDDRTLLSLTNKGLQSTLPDV